MPFLAAPALNVVRAVPWFVARQQVHAVLVPQDVSRPLVQVYVHEEAGSWLKDALDKIQASEDEVRTCAWPGLVCAQPVLSSSSSSSSSSSGLLEVAGIPRNAPYRSS
jgi:hypothetical protein